MNVLIVEDDLSLTETLADFFRLECKQECFYAHSLKSARYVLSKVNFDVVILDYILKDGYAIELKNDLPKNAVTILISANYKIRQFHEQMETTYYFEKPFKPEEMDQLVKIVCDLKKEKK